MKNTSRLSEEQKLPIFSTPEPTTVDLGGRRPWRMVLIVKSMQVKLIIDLINTLSIGRFHEGSDVVPDVDLRPFDAEKLGVSRQHVFIKLEGDNLVVVDNKSSNGTVLNGQVLAPGQSHPLRHGDELVLGALALQVALLSNPLD
jgi:hypothetical protein